MELLGFKRALHHLLCERGAEVAAITTDRHKSIAAFMREAHPEIVHSYDKWHLAKNLKKLMSMV